MTKTSRAKVSFSVLIGVIVFLLGSMYHSIKIRQAQIDRLTVVNQTVVDKLTDILTHTLSAETAALEAGNTPAVRVEDIISQLKGVDQALIDEAVKNAYKNVAQGKTGATGATGKTGATGPTGPSGTTATTAQATTSTAQPTTTTTRAPPTTTTTRPATTTTTRPCSIRVLGLGILCGQPNASHSNGFRSSDPDSRRRCYEAERRSAVEGDRQCVS